VLGDVAINSLCGNRGFRIAARDPSKRRPSVEAAGASRRIATNSSGSPEPARRRSGCTGADSDRNGTTSTRDPSAPVGEPGDRGPAGGRKRATGSSRARGDGGLIHRVGTGPEGGGFGHLLYRGAQPHRMGWLMGSNEGRRGPARPDAKLTAAQVTTTTRSRRTGRGKGREGKRIATTAATPPTGAVLYDPREPGGRADPRRTDGSGHPRTFLRVGTFPETSPTSTATWSTRRCTRRNALKKKRTHRLPRWRDLHPHPTKDRTPVGRAALQNRSPSPAGTGRSRTR